MSANQAKKNLPKRASNSALKDRRKSRWLKGEERKKKRVAAQRERERANAELRAAGKRIPWERANDVLPGWTERREAARAVRRQERPSLVMRMLRTENKHRDIPADMRPLWKWNAATMRFERGNG